MSRRRSRTGIVPVVILSVLAVAVLWHVSSLFGLATRHTGGDSKKIQVDRASLHREEKQKSEQNQVIAEKMAGPPEDSRAPRVELETSMGSVEVELYIDHAPKTTKNFIELTKSGYYDGVVFHRIIRDFMIQGGDPTGTGRGGESYFGDKFEDEFTSELKFTGAGILAMANAGPDTNGSQFFITLAPTPWLDMKHTIFGRVYTGMGVVERMGLVQTDGGDRPVTEVKILRAKVTHVGSYKG
ncbi:unnamed protein product [Pedinophyceae sp. YPF-701]|nr:unnamed protein product [Pedinophyceae sp. YPF-701]